MIRFFLAGACACLLALGGCASAPLTAVIHHYTLGGPTTMTGHAAAAGHEVLQIARIHVPTWLADTGMDYRLDYRHANRLAVYGYSDWAAAPAQLLEALLQQTLARADDWRAVIGPDNPAHANVSLHLRLNDFSQHFATPDHSTGVVDATATLIDAADGHVIAQKHFHIDAAAPSADAQGGAEALGEASRQLAGQLERWLGLRKR
ncbi:MAG TPA: ABC-type transport auxiliary lipoprotein family protein [Rhodanobacteraceae bacterium]